MSDQRQQRITEALQAIGEDVQSLFSFTKSLTGQFLLDPNEINGWGILGPYDNSNTQDLGNVGAANLSRISGGFEFPFDVRVNRLRAKHYNSSGDALAWGWVMYKQSWIPDTNIVTTSYILDEVADNNGVAPRDYGNSSNQLTDVVTRTRPNSTINAGEVLTLAVASPTALTANRFVRVMSGFVEFERIV